MNGVCTNKGGWSGWKQIKENGWEGDLLCFYVMG